MATISRAALLGMILTAAGGQTAAQHAVPGTAVELAYGADPAQKLDLARTVLSRQVPLIVFVHGGGWAIGDKTQATGAKAVHFNQRGWAFASVNYRLVPAATVEQQAADVARALAFLRTHAIERGIDSGRIVLIGHSSGAHLAALVASDPRYLAAAKVPMSAIRGVVLLDGAGYDVARQMASPVNRVAAMYTAAFGADPARHKRLSPIAHAAAPNAANWLLLAVAQRPDSTAQSNLLAAALVAAGSAARVVPVANSSHAMLNRQLGTDGDAATAAVDAFIANL